MDHVHRIKSGGGELIDESIDHLRSVLRSRLVSNIDAARCDGPADVLEVAKSFLADDVELHFDPFSIKKTQKIARLLDEIGVESAGESAIRREKNHGGAVHLCRLPKKRKTLRKLRRIKTRNDFCETVGIGPRGMHAILRTFHFRSGDHLQRTRDLPRILDG